MPFGRLLERMAGTKYFGLLPGPADDLQSDRQSISGKSTRQGKRGGSGQIERGGEACQRRSLAGRIFDIVDRQGRDRRGGQKQNVILAEELLASPSELGLLPSRQHILS